MGHDKYRVRRSTPKDTDQSAIAPSYTTYHQAMARAEYYTWMALRGHVQPRDPLTGGRVSQYSALWIAASRAAAIAAAKFWLATAAGIRDKRAGAKYFEAATVQKRELPHPIFGETTEMDFDRAAWSRIVD